MTLHEVLRDFPKDGETPILSITKKNVTQQTSTIWLQGPLKGNIPKTLFQSLKEKKEFHGWIISQTFRYQLGFPSASVSVLGGWRLTWHYQSADRLLLHDPQGTGRTLKWSQGKFETAHKNVIYYFFRVTHEGLSEKGTTRSLRFQAWAQFLSTCLPQSWTS